ncbi:hypothetical protein evm_014257 [Chilo suppressalis]|nr:hypothetical protein evm_014257 [Chilo suppressalis]
MASRMSAPSSSKINPKWQRTRTIMALIPPEDASSLGSSISSEDEVLLHKPDDYDITYCSSEPRSYPSSLDRMHIWSSSENENADPTQPILLFSDEETIPLSPVINEMFPNGRSQEQLPFMLNSVSSVLSDSPATTTRSKRKLNIMPKVVAKRVKRFIRKPLTFKWQTIQSGATRCINIASDDIRDFIAITLLMGVVQMPAYRDYWSNSLRYPQIANIMSLKKDEKIRRYLHFVDNTYANDDRYFKVRPILEKIRNNCLQLVEEGRYSIEEMMVPYKGTRAGSRRQYLPKKPKKWGFKIFVRAGVSGLIYDFIPYAGEDTFRGRVFTEYENSLGLGAKVVIALCSTIKEKPATIYFDNFFTSLELIHHLREEFGFFSLGTVKSNRLRGCQSMLPSDKILSKKGRGASKQLVCNKNKTAVVKWQDNKADTLASSFVDSHPKEKIKRYCKDTKSKVDVECPQIVKQYNAHMGGVDLADMLISLYRSNFKTKRWYMALFTQCLDICVNNAWLQYRRDQPNTKPMTLKNFRVVIVTELLHRNRNLETDTPRQNDNPKKIQTPTAPRPPDSVRFDNTGHLPIFIKKGRCKYCKNGYTTVSCNKCKLRLCLLEKRNCFFNFHVSSEYRVCEECFVILQIQAQMDEPCRNYGHKSVCLGCGVSVLRARSIPMGSNRHECTVIQAWVPQIQADLPIFTRVCRPCWRRANRAQATSTASSQQELDQIMPDLDVGIQVDDAEQHLQVNVGVQVEDPLRPPTPPPLPMPVPDEMEAPQRPTITLPNYTRVASTSRRCIFSDCLNIDRILRLIPSVIRQRILIDLNIFIPRCARICSDHLSDPDWANLINERLINTFSSEQIEDMLQLSQNNQNVLLDFENIENMNDHIRHYWIGITVQQFNDILNGTASLTNRLVKYKTALAMYLAKLRTGDTDRRLSTIFGISKSTFNRYITIVRECLTQDYVSSHLGLSHIRVQEASEHNLIIPSELFGRHLTISGEQPLIVICDGTYTYTQKSSNYKFQKDTYSLHKYRNLVKPFLLVCSDGYILDILGPYPAKESDALIMKNAFLDGAGQMRSYFRAGDVFIVDRGFRDAVQDLQAYGYNVHMPESIEEGNFQLTTLQANKTRLITLVRWVVEVVNGRFKRDFRLLRHEFFDLAAQHIFVDFYIAGAIINHFHPLLRDRTNAREIVAKALSKLNVPNYLGQYVTQHNLNRQRANFRNISAHLPHLSTFPCLTMSQLEMISLGTYQIKQARSYYGEHVRDGGMFVVELNSQLEVPEEENINGSLIRGRISSRHSSKVYYTYITYSSLGNTEDSITGYYCNCKSGSRTVGCCSHVMVVIWFLSWARYNPDSLSPPAAFLDDILLNEE